jgi:hypothetical protein
MKIILNARKAKMWKALCDKCGTAFLFDEDEAKVKFSDGELTLECPKNGCNHNVCHDD